jgi:DNA-binding SARP family transcriptional activator
LRKGVGTEFRILGPVGVVRDGHSLPIGAPKQRALLATLLLEAARVVSRDRLIDALWGESPPKAATTSLQVYVHGLRQALGADRIETHGVGYKLRIEPGELDLERFQRLVERGRRTLADGHASDAAEDLRQALELWLGPPLADLSGEPIVDAEAQRLDELRLHAVELGNDSELALGRHDALIAELERLIAEQPYRERFREQYILALYRSGRRKMRWRPTGRRGARCSTSSASTPARLSASSSAESFATILPWRRRRPSREPNGTCRSRRRR